MSWKNIMKGNLSWEFETPNVPFYNYDSENNGWPEDGKCIVKWNFSFGQRDHGIREFGFFVHEIILQSNDYDTDDITITSKEHFTANTDVESYDKIWPTHVDIDRKENDIAQIEVLM
jgi:hypothetical protein